MEIGFNIEPLGDWRNPLEKWAGTQCKKASQTANIMPQSIQLDKSCCPCYQMHVQQLTLICLDHLGVGCIFQGQDIVPLVDFATKILFFPLDPLSPSLHIPNPVYVSFTGKPTTSCLQVQGDGKISFQNSWLLDLMTAFVSHQESCGRIEDQMLSNEYMMYIYFVISNFLKFLFPPTFQLIYTLQWRGHT